MSTLQKADTQRAQSAAMSGRMDERTALAAIVLWNCGHFDTKDISDVLRVGEDAVYRTLHAARHISAGKP
ncbi:hypothetical protein [Rhizobium sp. Root483D2]|uniref:hypothetical protein n=1 Tax=Rhizobium sp. Root483D2 TaxID=1736545 RepID=UPI0007123534|nr:hypothetical protein [Rhizobium sp. Root483D2]KQY20771.1 hypothetical protein ASD32_04980 [Rhizobium sp. Root483D2]